LLLLVVLFPSRGDATNSTYTVSPAVFLKPPFPNTKLILLSSNITFDPDAGRFYLTASTSYSSPNIGAGTLPTVTLTGYYALQQAGLVLFSFPSETTAYCFQSQLSSPPLCPLLQEYINGPFYFGAHPSDSSAPTQELILEAAPYVDPVTLKPFNFLGASIPLTYTCVDTCEPFGDQVPPAQMPVNALFTVCLPDARCTINLMLDCNRF
jgi:hypothetical protein